MPDLIVPSINCYQTQEAQVLGFDVPKHEILGVILQFPKKSYL